MFIIDDWSWFPLFCREEASPDWVVYWRKLIDRISLSQKIFFLVVVVIPYGAAVWTILPTDTTSRFFSFLKSTFSLLLLLLIIHHGTGGIIHTHIEKKNLGPLYTSVLLRFHFFYVIQKCQTHGGGGVMFTKFFHTAPMLFKNNFVGRIIGGDSIMESAWASCMFFLVTIVPLLKILPIDCFFLLFTTRFLFLITAIKKKLIK